MGACMLALALLVAQYGDTGTDMGTDTGTDTGGLVRQAKSLTRGSRTDGNEPMTLGLCIKHVNNMI